MSSRSGSHSRRQRSREPHDDFPALPASALPSLFSLATQRERGSSSSPSGAGPLQSRGVSAAARRADRIRALDEYTNFQRAFEQSGNPDLATLNSRSNRQRSAIDPRSSTFDDLGRSLDSTSAQLRELLELTSNHTNMNFSLPLPGSASPLPRSLDLPEDNRRNKRRKLDADRLAPSIKQLCYGRYGQVEPGALRMEILSCDGGMYASSNASSYAAENILKNDDTVYCTKGNRCNVVLRHEGGTPFTLQELVIKGPTSVNYSHPIREGMVFVAMRQDEVLTRTAQYQIQYAHLPRDPTTHEDPEREGPRVGSIRYNDDGTTTTRIRRSQSHRTEEEDYRIAVMPPEFASNIPDFGVTTICNDDDFDAEGRHISRRTPNRIGSLPFETADSDEENINNYNSGDFDFDDFLAAAHQANPTHMLRVAREQREQRDQRNQNQNQSQTQSQSQNQNQNQSQSQSQSQSQNRSESFFTDSFAMSFAEALEAHNNATQEAVRAVGGELLAPHARFYIEKRSSTCTLRFDPPVSARFILLKMWNSHHDPSSNIDIQTVMVRGYAGPRYFPAVELR